MKAMDRRFAAAMARAEAVGSARANLAMKSGAVVAARTPVRARLDAVTLPWQPMTMALTPAEKQQRYRDRRKAATQMSPDAVEDALVEEAERYAELSSEERAALANKLTDAAMRHQRRATELAEIARKMRPHGWNPPGFPK
jgi:uncharacterized protein YjiS (DUF1127 family)